MTTTANIPSWETTDLQQMAASGDLSGVSPAVIAAIAQAESSGNGGSINSQGYGGWFGLGENSTYPGGTSSKSLLQSTSPAAFEQQAALAASDFAAQLTAEGGNVLLAEQAYQGGQGDVGKPGAPTEGDSVFESLGLGDTVTDTMTTGQPAATPSAAPSATAEATIANQNTQQGVIAGMLQGIGLTATQINQLTSQAMTYLTNPNVTAAQALTDLQQSPVYNQIFPGIQQAVNNGYPPPSPSDYLSTVQAYQSLAQAAGMGELSSAQVGNLIGNNVSPNELGERITNGFQAVNLMDPNSRQAFYNEMNISPGQLANFFLDPDNSMGQLANQITAAQITGAGQNAGFAPISTSTAMQLAGAGVSQAAALSGFKQIAPLLPLTNRMLGEATSSPGTISQGQLISSEFVGDQPSTEAVRLAQETRGASTGGGGGYQAEKTGTAVGSSAESGSMGVGGS